MLGQLVTSPMKLSTLLQDDNNLFKISQTTANNLCIFLNQLVRFYMCTSDIATLRFHQRMLLNNVLMILVPVRPGFCFITTE